MCALRLRLLPAGTAGTAPPTACPLPACTPPSLARPRARVRLRGVVHRLRPRARGLQAVPALRVQRHRAGSRGAGPGPPAVRQVRRMGRARAVWRCCGGALCAMSVCYRGTRCGAAGGTRRGAAEGARMPAGRRCCTGPEACQEWKAALSEEAAVKVGGSASRPGCPLPSCMCCRQVSCCRPPLRRCTLTPLVCVRRLVQPNATAPAGPVPPDTDLCGMAGSFCEEGQLVTLNAQGKWACHGGVATAGGGVRC